MSRKGELIGRLFAMFTMLFGLAIYSKVKKEQKKKANEKRVELEYTIIDVAKES